MPVKDDFKSYENNDSKLDYAICQLCDPGKSPLNFEPQFLPLQNVTYEPYHIGSG